MQSGNICPWCLLWQASLHTQAHTHTHTHFVFSLSLRLEETLESWQWIVNMANRQTA